MRVRLFLDGGQKITGIRERLFKKQIKNLRRFNVR